jgi:hypothetical protein
VRPLDPAFGVLPNLRVLIIHRLAVILHVAEASYAVPLQLDFATVPEKASLSESYRETDRDSGCSLQR